MLNDFNIINDISDIEYDARIAVYGVLENIEETFDEYKNENDIMLVDLEYAKSDYEEIRLDNAYIYIPYLNVKIHPYRSNTRESELDAFELEHSGWMFFNNSTSVYLDRKDEGELKTSIIDQFKEQLKGCNIDQLDCEYFICSLNRIR